MPLRYRLRQEFYKNANRGPEEFRQIKQRYLGLVTEIDQSIGAILRRLDELELRERTLTMRRPQQSQSHSWRNRAAGFGFP